MDGFARRKEQSKEDIRHAAEELFSRFGADKVSINDIARKAGVSQATIYNNFGSKDELVKDYRHNIFEALASRFRVILVWKKSWFEKFQGIMQSVIDIADRYNLEMGKTGQTGKQDLISGQITIQSDNAIRTEIETTFRKFLKEGREQGNLRTDIPDEAIITYIRLFQYSIVNNPDIHNLIRRDAKLYQNLVSLFVYGVSGKSD
jgi:AcrR family transcriptional regulator